jgi:predicted Zn-dependent peptidase
MAQHPPGTLEVEKAKAIAETDFWTSMVDVDGKAEALGHYETTLGDFRRLNSLADRLAQVSVDDVARVAHAYLLPQRRTIVIAEPEHGADAGDDDA